MALISSQETAVSIVREVVNKLCSANTIPFVGDWTPKILQQIGQLFRHVISAVQA